MKCWPDFTISDNGDLTTAEGELTLLTCWWLDLLPDLVCESRPITSAYMLNCLGWFILLPFRGQNPDKILKVGGSCAFFADPCQIWHARKDRLWPLTRHVYYDTQPQINTQIWPILELWGLLYPLQVTNQGQIWHFRSDLESTHEHNIAHNQWPYAQFGKPHIIKRVPHSSYLKQS